MCISAIHIAEIPTYNPPPGYICVHLQPIIILAPADFEINSIYYGVLKLK